ncbi:hypothetical protein ACT7DA_12595 [Bacillus pacificus]
MQEQVRLRSRTNNKSASSKNITVINNKEGIKDTVKVTGLKVGTKVRVYGVATKGDVLGEVTSEKHRKKKHQQKV